MVPRALRRRELTPRTGLMMLAPLGETCARAAIDGMTPKSAPILHTLDQAADEPSEAASDLMLAAGHTAPGNDAYVLAEAVEAEVAEVTMTRLRYTPS